MTAHGPPNFANTAVQGQSWLPLLPRWAQGQRKAKASFFHERGGIQEELKKWDKRVRKEGEDALAISQGLRILGC